MGTVLTYGSQTQITNVVGAEINFPEFDLKKELQITAEHFHPEVFNEALDILDIEYEQIETGRVSSRTNGICCQDSESFNILANSNYNYLLQGFAEDDLDL